MIDGKFFHLLTRFQTCKLAETVMCNLNHEQTIISSFSNLFFSTHFFHIVFLQKM